MPLAVKMVPSQTFFQETRSARSETLPPLGCHDSLLASPATIHRDVDTSHLIGCRAAHEDGQGTQVAGLHKLAAGLLLQQQLPLRLFLALASVCSAQVNLSLHQGGQHPARADAVAGHTSACSLQSHSLCEAYQAVLCCNIGALVDTGHMPVHTGNVDDPSVALGLHAGQAVLDQVEAGAEVDGQDLVPLLLRELLHWADVLDACIVDLQQSGGWEGRKGSMQ